MKITALVEKGIGKNKCEDALLICDEVVSENAVSKNITDECGCIAVADGVGGNVGGYEASNYLLDYISDNYKSAMNTLAISAMLKQANEDLVGYGRHIKNLLQMATTFSGVFFQKDTIVMAHVGNTRLYCIQGNYLKQLTMDHTTYNWLKLHNNYEEAEACNKSEIISCFGGGG